MSITVYVPRDSAAISVGADEVALAIATSAAAAGMAKSMPEDFRVSLVDAPGKESWPISGLTWILVYQDQKDEPRGKAIVQFLKWAIRDGQKMEAALDYAELPKPVVEKVDKALKRISFKGKSLY